MNKKMPAFGGAAAIAVLVTLGCTAASATATNATTNTNTNTNTNATTNTLKNPRSAVHLTAYTDNDGPTETVIVTGAIGDFGQAVSVNPDGSVNPEHNSQLELRMAHGTFRLDIAGMDKAFVAAMLNQFPTDKKTCSGTVEVTQRVPIVQGSGTGAYKGVSGEFSLTLVLDEVDKVSPDCNGTDAFLSQTIVTSGAGSVSF